MKDTKNMISTIYQTLHASDMKELEVIYTQWASHYEHDVIKLAGYVGHIVTTEILLRYLKMQRNRSESWNQCHLQLSLHGHGIDTKNFF